MSAVAPRFICSANQAAMNGEANAGIQVCSIVKLDATETNGFEVEQASAVTDKPVGIAQEGSWYPPGVLGADDLAAHPGQPLTVYGDGEECLAIVGSAAVVAGDSLAADTTANHQGFLKTVAFTAGAGIVWQVARALESGNSGEKIRVLVQIAPIYGITA